MNGCVVACGSSGEARKSLQRCYKKNTEGGINIMEQCSVPWIDWAVQRLLPSIAVYPLNQWCWLLLELSKKFGRCDGIDGTTFLGCFFVKVPVLGIRYFDGDGLHSCPLSLSWMNWETGTPAFLAPSKTRCWVVLSVFKVSLIFRGFSFFLKSMFFRCWMCWVVLSFFRVFDVFNLELF